MNTLARKIYLFGVDARSGVHIPDSILNCCDRIIGSKRIVEEVTRQNPALKDLVFQSIVPLEDAFSAIKQSLTGSGVIVFGSGDPLFFGIGRKLIERFGEDSVEIFPALSSFQYAFAKAKSPWDDAKLISLHGRGRGNYLGTILGSKKSMVLTDNVMLPEVIAGELCDFLGPERSKSFEVHVIENIGMESERVVTGDLSLIRDETFGAMCCVVIENKNYINHNGPLFGRREEDIEHSRGLITKNEVRSAVLHALKMYPGNIVWDIGGGSGSVSVEAAILNNSGLVYTVERNSEQKENIQKNFDNLGLLNAKLIDGEAPEALSGLPEPDRVFIGGSGGNLEDIISFSAAKLKPAGRIVVSAVLEKTANDAPQFLHNEGLEVEISRVSVSRFTYPQMAEQTFNPITIIAGKKGI